MLGGLYESVLRAELTHRFGVAWKPIVKGIAEIAGAPADLLAVFSKRAAVIDRVVARRVAEFQASQGRDPTAFELDRIGRTVAANTRSPKSGHGVPDLVTRWHHEAEGAGWTAERYRDVIDRTAHDREVEPDVLQVDEVIDALSVERSARTRADVVRAICDRQQPMSRFSGHDWARAVETAADLVVDRLVDLDPIGTTDRCRESDGRSVWIPPTADRYTSNEILTQEEQVISWAMLAQVDDPAPSTSLDMRGLDAAQADAAAAVAGHDRLVLVVGPAGAGKTRTLAAAVDDLRRQGRVALGVTPTAKAARVLARDTGMPADTVAKVLHDWNHYPMLSGAFDMAPGGTLICDEAAMLSTPNLYDLITLVEQRQWRLALVGDPRQLQAVGRGGLVAELCANGRVDTLDRLHRFSQQWEAAASLQLRHGNPDALDAYEEHGRIHGGTLDDHLAAIAERWLGAQAAGESIAVVASSNDHVNLLNHAIQHARRERGQLDTATVATIAAGEQVHVGDVVVTRRNDRRLATNAGEPIRNRETWAVTAIQGDGALTVQRHRGGDAVVLPVEYVRNHVRLGYAATEHGYQADSVDTAMALTTTTTSRRGLYVAMTRGRDRNDVCVVTDTADPAEARDVLEQVLAVDRADTPAVAVRRELAALEPRPQPSPRCTIPDWFEAYLDRARRDLAAVSEQRGDGERRVADARAALDAARDRLAVVERDTAAVRGAVDHARQPRDHYLGQHRDLAGRIEHAGRRDRRRLRGELDDIGRLVDTAGQRLQRLEANAAPSLEVHTTAVSEYRVAETRQRDQQRDQPSVVMLERLAADKVDVLAAWQHWAHGRHVDADTLVDIHRALTAIRSPEALQLARAIARDHVAAEQPRSGRQRSAQVLAELSL